MVIIMQISLLQVRLLPEALQPGFPLGFPQCRPIVPRIKLGSGLLTLDGSETSSPDRD